jgi:hypothetical protein
MDESTHSAGSEERAPRAPQQSDLSRLCAELNRLGARYIVVGGWAIIHAGYPRLTVDIDLLVDASPENEARVFQALRSLPDQAVNDLDAGDIEKFTVVRVADEVMVDLMKSACGVDYAAAVQDAVVREMEGVRIPFASPGTLWRMKQTRREKDIPDRTFLRMLLESQGAAVEPAPAEGEPGETLWRCIKRLFGKEPK